MDVTFSDLEQGDGDLAIESFGSLVVGYLVIATIVLLPYLAAYSLYRMTW